MAPSANFALSSRNLNQTITSKEIEMTAYDTTAAAAVATYPAREQLAKLIENRMECMHASPAKRVCWMEEAKNLIEEIEMWVINRDPHGCLVFRDPADDVLRDTI